MSDSEFGSMAMEAHGVTGGAVISVDQTNGQCLTVGGELFLLFYLFRN